MKRPRVDRRVDCPWCGGDGYVDMLHTKAKKCPQCSGHGKVSKYAAKEIEQRLKR